MLTCQYTANDFVRLCPNTTWFDCISWSLNIYQNNKKYKRDKSKFYEILENDVPKYNIGYSCTQDAINSNNHCTAAKKKCSYYIGEHELYNKKKWVEVKYIKYKDAIKIIQKYDKTVREQQCNVYEVDKFRNKILKDLK